jgi:DNA-binding CsgD family transcriptional regulator
MVIFWSIGHSGLERVRKTGENLPVGPTLPLISSISELVTFIQQEDPDANALCQFSVIRTLNFLDATGMLAAKLDTDGSVFPIGQFGFSADNMKSWERTHINDSIPTADALRTNNIIWVGNKEDLLQDYPQLATYKIDARANAFIAWPITIAGSYMSVLGLTLQSSPAPTPELISFLETIGGLFALQLSKSQNFMSSPEILKIVAQLNLLTRRQREVLDLVADGLTNSQIADELDFSESTIRQETMRIYEILGATGRSDAIRMFRSAGQRKVS